MIAKLARGVAAALAAATLIGLAGCSGSKVDVSGKVRYNGKTLTSGTVSLFGRDNMQHMGSIGPDGTYTISGVPTGTVKIVVTSPNPDASSRKSNPKGGDSDLTAPAAPAASAAGWFRIPDKYGDLATTDLTGEVQGNPAVLDIDLK